MTDEYGPFVVLQTLPPLRLPMKVEPESGELVFAKPRDSYTQFAIVKEAASAIRRDEEARGYARSPELEIVPVDTWEAYVQAKLPRNERT
jgi:hypothetical protein